MNKVSRVVSFIMAMLVLPINASAEENKPLQQTKIFVSPSEIKAGKAIAESNCIQCHGVEGVSTTEIVPHLAGQHLDYLFTQLQAYRDGLRVEAKMRKAVGALSDKALSQVAGYYSSLDPPLKVADEASDSVTVDPIAAGKKAAGACGSCHGPTGNGAFPSIPLLSGKHKDYIASATKAYKNGSRKDPMMQLAVSMLSEEDIENISLFYATQKPLASTAKAKGDVTKGATIAAASCNGCHGEAGNSASADTPSLAGQDPQYFSKATLAYKTAERNHPIMQSMVSTLSEEDIANLSAYYAAQLPKTPDVRIPLTTEQWAEKCDRCHGINGNSIDPLVPSIAGQRRDYIVKAINDYKAHVRVNKMMFAMTKLLTEKEIENLAKHYSSKQGKSVIFITLPQH